MEKKAEVYTSSLDHWCGDCNKVIPADTPYLMKYTTYPTPSGGKRYRTYPAHIGCKEQKNEPNSK